MLLDVKLLEGGTFSDYRGSLNFVNEFKFVNVKRFYELIHTDTTNVRAWQGHKIEHKYFYVTSGAFLIVWVKIDDWSNPSAHLQTEKIVLSSDKPFILHIPNGYANGIKALMPHSRLTVYSNLSLNESEADRWSFDSNLWFDWKQFN